MDLGLAGLLVPEERGGAGASAREAAVVMEELGRFVAPVSFLTSAVVATIALRGTNHEILDGLGAGQRTAALTVPLHLSAFGFRATVRLDGEGRLYGAVASVAGALDADVLVVPVRNGAGVELHPVDVDGVGVTVEAVTSLDMTRQLADIVFTRADSTIVVAADAGDAAVREALEVGAALLASEQLGVAQWYSEPPRFVPA